MIIKVDIRSGEVLENNLHELWARERMRGGLVGPGRPIPDRKSQPRGRQDQKLDQTLMGRIKKFRASINKRSSSWREEELYRLAILIGCRKMPYRQAGKRLARSPAACKNMYWRMKNEGVI